MGAVAIKQSVYALPLSEQSREDFSWILREIVEGGGDGSISEARFVEGLTDDQVVALFQTARKTDYDKFILETGQLLNGAAGDSEDEGEKRNTGPVQLSRIQRKFNEIAAIDFFDAPEKGTAEIVLRELETKISNGKPAENLRRDPVENLKGKVWVTRANLFVDRIACGWLIRKYVDKDAQFKYVNGSGYHPKADEIRFDMFDGEYTHEGELCTFEVMLRRLRIQDKGVCAIAEMVHDVDLKDNKYERAETAGFQAMLAGLVAAGPDDDRRMEQGYELFENLYSYYRRQ